MTFAKLVDKKPAGVILSPSQIEKYDRCKRRWAIEYIGGMRPPPHPSAQLGTDVHTVLENWLRDATPPNTNTKAGKIASRMISNLPPPGTGEVERQFYLTTRNGLLYTGKIDWSGIFHGAPTAVDHKTTGNLAYAKTEAQLHSDLQAITYTLAGCLGFGTGEMQLLWNYATTKGRDPEVRAVRTKISLPVVEAKFESVVEPIAAEITAARKQGADPMSFPPNPAACEDFGGCPHRSTCNLTEQERLRALMTDQAPTLATRLAGFPGGNGFSPPAFGAPAPMAPAPQAPYAAVVPPGVAYMPQAPQSSFAPPAAPQAPPAAFTPPGAPMMPPAVSGSFTPPQGGFAPPGGAQAPLAGQQPLPFNPEGGPNPPESGIAAPQSAEEPKRGRGRPRKAKQEETVQEAAVQHTPSPAPAPATPPFNEVQFFLAGVTALMGSPNWDGTIERARWAGEMAVQLGKERFGG